MKSTAKGPAKNMSKKMQNNYAMFKQIRKDLVRDMQEIVPVVFTHTIYKTAKGFSFENEYTMFGHPTEYQELLMKEMWERFVIVVTPYISRRFEGDFFFEEK